MASESWRLDLLVGSRKRGFYFLRANPKGFSTCLRDQLVGINAFGDSIKWNSVSGRGEFWLEVTFFHVRQPITNLLSKCRMMVDMSHSMGASGRSLLAVFTNLSLGVEQLACCWQLKTSTMASECIKSKFLFVLPLTVEFFISNRNHKELNEVAGKVLYGPRQTSVDWQLITERTHTLWEIYGQTAVWVCLTPSSIAFHLLFDC